jgi:hypothetical protein
MSNASINLGSTAILRPTQLEEVLRFHEKMAEPLIILGPPGVGKSEMVQQVSATAGRKLVYQDNSSADPTDLGGIPFPVKDADGNLIVNRAVFKKFIDNEPLTIFVDETFQGSPAVMNSTAPLFLEKRLGDWNLPPETWILGATNRPQDRAGTHRPPSHIPNRVTIVEVGFHVDDLRSHWIDLDMPVPLLGFAKYCEDAIFDFDPNRLINATPRSWTWVGKNFDGLMHLSQSSRMATIAGRVTEGHAAKFIGFCNIFQGLPSIEDALMNPTTIPIPEALDVRYAFTAAISHAATKDNFDRIALIEERLPRNLGVMLVNDAQRRCKEIKATKAFTQWAIKNANVLL